MSDDRSVCRAPNRARRSRPSRALATLAAVLASSLVGLVPSRARSQSMEPRPARRELRNGLHADLGLHVIGVAYERVLDARAALQVAAEYYAPWTVNNNVLGLAGSAWDGPRALWGMGVRVRALYFLTDRAPRGLFVTPFVQFMHLVGTSGSETSTGPGFALGMSLGYSLVIADVLALRLGAGVQYHTADVTAGGRALGFTGLYPQLEIQAGWVF